MKNKIIKTAALAFLVAIQVVKSQSTYLLVTEGYSGRVSKIDPITNTKIASIRVADSTGPSNFATTDIVVDTVHNWAFVACNASNKIAVINLSNWTTTYPSNPVIAGFGQQPIGITINKTATKLYVTTRGATGSITATNPVEVIDIVGSTFPPTLTKSANIPVGKHPIKVVLSHNQQFGVASCRNESRVAVFSLATNSVIYNYNYPNPTYEPEGLALHPTQNIVYITNHGVNTIDVLNLQTMSVVATVTLPIGPPPAPAPSGGMFSPNGNKFVVCAQSSNKLIMYNTSSPLLPTVTGTYVSSGGQQPHIGVFLNDSVAYVPNTNNLLINGGVAYFNINNFANAVALPGTWNGPLGMAKVKPFVTSISENKKNNYNLELYPNPSDNEVYIHAQISCKPVKIEILNYLGQVLYSMDNVSGPIKFDTSELQKGTYLINVVDGTRKVATKKLIKY